MNTPRKLVAADDLGELGEQHEAGVQRDDALACPVDDLAWRTGLPEQTRQDGVGVSDDPHVRGARRVQR